MKKHPWKIVKDEDATYAIIRFERRVRNETEYQVSYDGIPNRKEAKILLKASKKENP